MHRLVFLHGFTQTHRHWHAAARVMADRVAPDATLALVDLPGHGLAAADVDGSIDDVRDRLVRVAGRGTYVGYSMGGRCALVAAATGATEIERLVVIGATAGIENSAERAERVRLDWERADRVVHIGVDAFVDEWLAMPMFARLPNDADSLAHRRSNTANGLAHSLSAYGTGAQTPIWDALADISVPVLVLAGELDTKFVTIGRRLAGSMPRATFAVIPGAGHAAHTERPHATAAAVAEWLANG